MCVSHDLWVRRNRRTLRVIAQRFHCVYMDNISVVFTNTRLTYASTIDYLLFLSCSTSSTDGRTKSYFHIHTRPVCTSPSAKPISFHFAGSFSSIRSVTRDFLVANTGSVPRNGECDGYSAVVRLQVLGIRPILWEPLSMNEHTRHIQVQLARNASAMIDEGDVRVL